MLTLHLVRHAKSTWEFLDLPDIDRPLNGRGLRDAHAMAARWKTDGIIPDVMISSTATRALSTALIFARKINYPEQNIILAPAIYEAPPAAYAQTLAHLPASTQSVAVFGHNPTLTTLINQLAEHPLENLPTCGIATIQLPASDWKNIFATVGILSKLDFPKNGAEG